MSSLIHDLIEYLSIYRRDMRNLSKRDKQGDKGEMKYERTWG